MDDLLSEQDKRRSEISALLAPTTKRFRLPPLKLPKNFNIHSEPDEMGYKQIRIPSPVLKTSDQYEKNMSSATPVSCVPKNLTPKLQNIVSTADMGCRLNLKTIATNSANSEFNPKRMTAVIMRIREPRTTALIFSSGKFIVTGAKSENESKLAARKFARIIQKLNFPAKFLNFKIQNIVASCDVEFSICLEKLDLAQSPFSSYEPELFPGIVYRIVKPRVVILIFGTGKIIITGAKVRQEIFDAFEYIYPILKSNEKKTRNTNLD